MYENEFQRIITASKTNSLTFFIGAGLSAMSNVPLWKDLINDICDKIGIERKKSYSSDEFLQIPQIYYQTIDNNDEEYYNFINSLLCKAVYEPNEIHDILFKLKPASIITTNFDTLIETAAAKACYSMKVVAADNEVSTINGDRFILKVHGDLSHQNIVFKEEDYLNYSENFKLIETLLKSIFSTNTVVFIGYGLNDYNIKLVLNWTKFLLKDNFNHPIFIYTDDKALSGPMLSYHKSRGLSVIDVHEFTHGKINDIEYPDRYRVILNDIIKSSDILFDGKDKVQKFNLLYKKLKPLNSMHALRQNDIVKLLAPHIYIVSNRILESRHDNEDILEYYLEIGNMSDNEIGFLSGEEYKRYKEITDIFIKANIQSVTNKKLIVSFDLQSETFRDNICIKYDYNGMLNFVRNKLYPVKWTLEIRASPEIGQKI